MQRKKLMGLVAVLLCLVMLIPIVPAEAATVLYENKTGNQDGYDYCLWKDYGSTSMTLTGGGTFECY